MCGSTYCVVYYQQFQYKNTFYIDSMDVLQFGKQILVFIINL